MTDMLDRSRLIRLPPPDRWPKVAVLTRGVAPRNVDDSPVVHHIVEGDYGVAVSAIGNPDGVFTLQWYWDVPQTTWARSGITPIEMCSLRLTVRRIDSTSRTAGGRARSVGSHHHDQWRAMKMSASVAEIVEMQARHALGYRDRTP